MIVVVDYGLGNIKSIVKMVEKIGYRCLPSTKPEILNQAQCLILPGVGNFSQAIKAIKDRGLFDMLNDLVIGEQKPIIGICLGMQLMCKSSQEGDSEGFGWVNAKVKKIDNVSASGKKIIVPHMGWNTVKAKKNNELLKDMPNEIYRFYFVHSYYVDCKEEDVFLTTKYSKEFCSAFIKDNIIGVQFHPEKSHKYGMQLLSNIFHRMQLCKED